MLTVKNLTKVFGGFTAVSSVDFSVEKGEILGLIGPNGSGKSTIFNMLSGVHFPTTGSINFNNQELSGLYPHVICNLGIGRTFQIPRPFKRLSILENAALAGYFGSNKQISKLEAWSNAEEALSLVGLGKVANEEVAVFSCQKVRSCFFSTYQSSCFIDNLNSSYGPSEYFQRIDQKISTTKCLITQNE